LLNIVREACDKFGLQYILTVIDSDLPRDESDRKLLFTEEEIVRYLHDRGTMVDYSKPSLLIFVFQDIGKSWGSL